MQRSHASLSCIVLMYHYDHCSDASLWSLLCSGRRYHVFRVYGVGSPEPQILDVKDPASMWERQEVAVYLAI
eukprot:354472-Chlamydomonas_euryale.AAC.3